MDIRPLFTSRFATMATMIGVAVGLGNVWRFPYMMGKFGGSAFLVLYLLFTFLFAIPAVMAEWALGREFRSGPLGVFRRLFGDRFGGLIGNLLLITVVIADSYYLVVIGNVLFSAFFSLTYGFTAENIPLYNNLSANGFLQYGISLFLLIFSLAIISRGLNRGISTVSKIFVPFFLVVMLILIGYVLTIDGAIYHITSFLQFDIRAINAEVMFAALGQSFFSLGLGGTFLLMYGSYMSDSYKIPGNAILLSFGDVGAALMASLFIIPSVLLFGMDLAAGPSLIFNVFPELFAVMPLGNWLGGIFLLALGCVALLSNIAALEVIAGSYQELKFINLNRKQIIVVLAIVESLLILPSAFYPELIGHLDLIFGSGMQTFGSLLSIIGLTWMAGKSKIILQIFAGKEDLKSRLYYHWTRWVVPVVLIAILISYLWG